MAVHRFTINVPNPNARAETVELRLEPMKKKPDAKGLHLPKGALRIDRAGLTLDPCGADLTPTLRVKLKPFTSIDVTAVVEAAARGKGWMAFHVTDLRERRVIGGVTIVCVEPPRADVAGVGIPARHPCAVVISGQPYAVAPESDPSKRPTRGGAMPGAAFDLVVPLMNPTEGPLSHVQAYLEHLGGSDATFRTATWNIGTMAPKSVFYATWRVDPQGSKTGTFNASVVVSSKGSDPTRVKAAIRMARRKVTTSNAR